jgi:glycosyltransferase 2 family protein
LALLVHDVARPTEKHGKIKSIYPIMYDVMKKHRVITIVGFVLSMVLLYFSMKDIEFHKIWETVKRTNPLLVFFPLFFIGAAVSFSSFKWSRIAGPTVCFREAFVALLIGLFVNNVLPARIGEVARGYVLSKKKGFSFTYSFSTVLLDRFFDLTGLLLLTFVFFPKGTLPPTVSKAIYLLLGLLSLCIALIILLSRERIAHRVSGKLLTLEKAFLRRFARRIVEVQENMKRITSPFMIIYLICISFLAWFSMSVALYVIILALGISMPFAYVPFVCALLNMGITIPSSPGYVGLYQFLLVYLLSIFGVPKYEGFTVSVLYHASWYVPYTVVGFIFLIREHLRIRDIKKLEEEPESETLTDP